MHVSNDLSFTATIDRGTASFPGESQTTGSITAWAAVLKQAGWTTSRGFGMTHLAEEHLEGDKVHDTAVSPNLAVFWRRYGDH